MIKAIETVYKGYRFRSRLEARWAVFFDEMGIEYQYEPEGFETPFGWYLPDFYLPKMNAWVEVKGGREWTPDERAKLTNVCSLTDCIGLFVYGDPLEQFSYPNNKTIMIYTTVNSFSDTSLTRVSSKFVLGKNKESGVPSIMPLVDHKTKGFANVILNAFDRNGDYANSGLIYSNKSWVTIDKASEIDFSITKRCAQKARQARFEHGDSQNGIHP